MKLNINLFKKPKLLIIFIIILILLAIGAYKIFENKTITPKYQTATVEKGTLITTVSASGTIASTNSTPVTTQASGLITKIYVKDGDVVKVGDPIAEIELDQVGQQKSAQAYASYLSAKNSVDSAQTNLYTLRSDMLTKWDSYMETAQNSTYQNSDGTANNENRQLSDFVSTSDNWLATEAKYKAQQTVISAAQNNLSSAWYSYQQSSPIIYAPISGTVSGFSLQVGSVISASSTTNTTSTKIANIINQTTPTVSISLTEVDVPKVAVGNKVSLTMDAFPDKTFTGKIISIDTVGSVSSGVTSYPAVIAFDTNDNSIYPNMSVNAKIITLVKNDVILIPSAAIQSSDGQNSVRVMKNNQAESVAVEIGNANDTQTEIISGLNEGDIIITSVINSSPTTTSSNTSSPFSSFGGGNRSSGNVRVIGR